jgi:copper(I)-binding protein
MTVAGENMFGLTKLRLIEIGVALLLTLGAILFVGLTVWAADAARISIADAWARPTIGQGRMSAVYMKIANQGDQADRLTGAHSPKAKSVELHQTTMTADGVMQMREVEDGLPIEAGGALLLEPGGTHFMLVGLETALNAGEELMLTLEFANAGAVDVVVPVSTGEPAAH